MPDFDQRQDFWQNPTTFRWSWCGPVAAANSLWWFDSKFEPHPTLPPAINDGYPLVQAASGTHFDDHDPLNVPPLVQNLAGFVDTDGMRTGISHEGTTVENLQEGVLKYMFDHGLGHHYYEKSVRAPTFDWVADQVLRSEDVILLLGFWQYQGDRWVRIGGHYVTLAGVDVEGGRIGLSDPMNDIAESPMGLPGPDHPLHPGDPTVHNDARFVSHDIYGTQGTNSPGGIWGPEGYVQSYDDIENFVGQNWAQDLLPYKGDPVPSLPVITEVDYAIVFSPTHRPYLPLIMHAY